MRLLWISYKKRPPCLYLYLGEKNEKLIGFLDNSITHEEIFLIRQSLDYLEKQAISKQLSWFKENTPQAYRNALRTLDKRKTSVIREYNLKNQVKTPSVTQVG
jgi:hypothetical protein